MRSQGKRPGRGSHVKRVDHGDAVDEWRSFENVDGSLFHIEIWYVMGHQDQYGQTRGNISEFAMWLSQSSVYIYKTDQNSVPIS